MSDPNVTVTFGAQTGDLNAAIEKTRAQIKALSDEAQRMAQKMITAGQTSNAAMVDALKKIQAESIQAASALKIAESGLGSIGGAASGAHAGMSGIFLELRALADEASSGRWRNFDGSLLRLGFLSHGLVTDFVKANAALVGFGAAATAAAAAIGVYAVKLGESQEQLRRLSASAEGAQFQQTEQQAAALRDQFSQLANVSKDSATDILASFDVIGAGGRDLATALIPYAKAMAQAEGIDLADAFKKLLPIMSDLGGAGLKYLETLRSLTESERQHYIALVAAGRGGDAMKVILDALAAQWSKTASATKENTAALNASKGSAADMSAAAESAAGQIAALADAEAKAGVISEQMAAQLKAAANAVIALGNDSDVTAAKLKQNADKIADSYDKLGAESRKLGNDRATLMAELGNAQKANSGLGDISEINRIEAAIRALNQAETENSQKSADTFGRDKLAQDEAAVQHLENTWRGSTEGMKQAVVNFWETARNQAGLSDAQILAVNQKLEAAQKALWEDGQKAGAKAAKDELGATQASIEGQISEIERQTSYETAHYEVMVKLKQMTEGDKAKAVVEATQKEAAAIDALYAKELALAGLTYTKITELQNKQRAENDKLSEAIYEAQAKAAEQTQQAWQAATNSFNSAWDSQIDKLLTGTEKWSAAFKNVLKDLTEQMIRSGLNRVLTGTENSLGGALGAPGASSQQGLHSLFTPFLAALGLNTAATTTNTTQAAITTAVGETGNAAYGANTIATTANTTATAAATGASGGGLFGIFGALVPHFASGSPYVQSTGLAMIHAGERIVPANLNNYEGISSMLEGSRGSQGASAGGGGSVSISPSVNLSVSAIDGASVRDWMRNNASDFAKQVHKASREGALLGLRRWQR